jgi:hypothetical protein
LKKALRADLLNLQKDPKEYVGNAMVAEHSQIYKISQIFWGSNFCLAATLHTAGVLSGRGDQDLIIAGLNYSRS